MLLLIQDWAAEEVLVLVDAGGADLVVSVAEERLNRITLSTGQNVPVQHYQEVGADGLNLLYINNLFHLPGTMYTFPSLTSNGRG